MSGYWLSATWQVAKQSTCANRLRTAKSNYSGHERINEAPKNRNITWISKMFTSWWCYSKNWRIIRICRIHPLWNMNVQNIFVQFYFTLQTDAIWSHDTTEIIFQGEIIHSRRCIQNWQNKISCTKFCAGNMFQTCSGTEFSTCEYF